MAVLAPLPRRSLPGTLDGVREGLGALEQWADQAGLSAELRRRLLTALDEVLSNVVRHSFRGRPGRLWLSIAAGAAEFRVTVGDDAARFDPMAVAAPDVELPLDKRRPGGLGVALIRALADEVHYARENAENVLTLTWRLDAT
jgi:anti-sigma regulatory factor (Ser/Thr protein kinase)